MHTAPSIDDPTVDASQKQQQSQQQLEEEPMHMEITTAFYPIRHLIYFLQVITQFRAAQKHIERTAQGGVGAIGR
jgi:hypothetical protein